MKFLKSMTAVLSFSLAASAFGECASAPRLILPGDYPDPTILRDGSDYYMTHSPFLYTPGFLIWHSKDLVHWEPLGRALTKVVGSAMAPDLTKHDGRYFIYYPTQQGTNWVIWADNIRGPWSDPVELKVRGIDPGHAVGADGKRYLFINEGRRVPLADDGLSVTGPIEKVYDGWEYPKDWKTEGMYLEAPKIFRKGGYFYLVSAEGGTAGPPTSHMVVAARSKRIDGPWENSPYNPIVHTYSGDEPWWSKGHGTVIDDVNGNWWLVYHAYERGAYPLGRQTLLEPLEWLSDGWFRLAGTLHPLPSAEAASTAGMKLSDDFSGNELGLQWTTWRDYNPAHVTVRDGSLRLRAKGKTPADARLLLTTATESAYTIQAEVDLAPGSIGGLVLFYSEKAFVGITSDGRGFTVHADASRSTRHDNRAGRRWFLKIINRGGTCTLQASRDGLAWETLGDAIDISGMHHNRFKGFFALRPGLMAAGEGEVRFTQFQYQATGP